MFSISRILAYLFISLINFIISGLDSNILNHTKGDKNPFNGLYSRSLSFVEEYDGLGSSSKFDLYKSKLFEFNGSTGNQIQIILK